MILVLGVFKISSQSGDIAISYILRELQIQLAKEYDKELSRSLAKFTEYLTVNTVFYNATKLGTPASSAFNFDFPKEPCKRKWGPLIVPMGPIALMRCKKKFNLLEEAYLLVGSIPISSTSYPTKSAVRSRIRIKTSTIRKNINKEVLNH